VFCFFDISIAQQAAICKRRIGRPFLWKKYSFLFSSGDFYAILIKGTL